MYERAECYPYAGFFHAEIFSKVPQVRALEYCHQKKQNGHKIIHLIRTSSDITELTTCSCGVGRTGRALSTLRSDLVQVAAKSTNRPVGCNTFWTVMKYKNLYLSRKNQQRSTRHYPSLRSTTADCSAVSSTGLG